ncbi:response regulator [Pleurocapsales cyanobacterium LEGE 06147]|nr:response regulator [Pleurocapsales cyanobacterium LEGE 06147]
MTTKRILVCDDEGGILAIAQLGLQMQEGWEIITASCGKEAIAIAETEQPDVVVLDVMMPDIDGPATLDLLRANPSTQSIPVIFLTAKTRNAEYRQLMHLPVAGIIAKPFNPLTLGSKIAEILGW